MIDFLMFFVICLGVLGLIVGFIAIIMMLCSLDTNLKRIADILEARPGKI